MLTQFDILNEKRGEILIMTFIIQIQDMVLLSAFLNQNCYPLLINQRYSSNKSRSPSLKPVSRYSFSEKNLLY